MKVSVKENDDIHCVKFRIQISSSNPEETFFPTAEEIEHAMDESCYDFGEENHGTNRHWIYSDPIELRGKRTRLAFIVEATNHKTDEWLPNEEDIERVMNNSGIVDDGNVITVTEIFRTISQEEMRDIRLGKILP
jgi:hypothetical protein